MRHLKAGRKLGRTSSHREAMFRNMVTSLLVHGRIKTTNQKAKELRRFVEPVLNLGARVAPSTLEGLTGDALAKAKARRLHHIRRASRWVLDQDALTRVFGEYAELYKERPGGYTRIYKLGFREGDNADMALIELVREPYGAAAAPKAKKSKAKKADAAPAATPESEAPAAE